ncbi:hypothetical protein NDU88_002611 [Pleurodeles waltl]|uniref:Uncharacterized protein n=1 Tax=Pleurodeles waltl TaxID=8319 RepID=A0AAV7TL60_PLEWA|nr:hypothetical protein NDU88_002611 [Pleurodeles waltl]
MPWILIMYWSEIGEAFCQLTAHSAAIALLCFPALFRIHATQMPARGSKAALPGAAARQEKAPGCSGAGEPSMQDGGSKYADVRQERQGKGSGKC